MNESQTSSSKRRNARKNKYEDTIYQPFYRILDRHTGYPLQILYDESEIQNAVDNWLPHRDIKVDGYEPYGYEDEIVGKITFMAHLVGPTPEYTA